MTDKYVCERGNSAVDALHCCWPDQIRYEADGLCTPLANCAGEQDLRAELGFDDRARMNSRPIGWEGLVAIVGTRVETQLSGQLGTDNDFQDRAANRDGTDKEGNALARCEATAGDSLELDIEFLANNG